MEPVCRPFANPEKTDSQKEGWHRGCAHFLPIVSLAAALALSCGVEPARGPAPSVAPKTGAAIPAAMRAAYLRARQNEAGADLAFLAQRGAPTTFAVRNRGQGVAATLDSQGLHVRHRVDLPAASLTLQHYGCAAVPRVATPTPPLLGPRPNRVEYRHDGVSEWYLNGPLGLEHGFTLDKDPECGGSSQLAFSLLLGGDLAATLSGQGARTRLELRDPKTPTEPPILAYSDLFALDADGKELPSRMLLDGRTVRLEVDAAGARYPVTVDPMWTQQTVLASSDGAANDLFGASVAVDGDTAIIGAPFKSVGAHAQQGQAYVFVRSGSSWIEQATLMDSATGATGDWFGMAVSVSGDTAVIGAGFKTVGTNTQQGQAYVFVRSGGTWSQQAVLVDSLNGADGDLFGSALAVSGDTIVIGARQKTIGANAQQGQAYVFVRSGTSWSQQAILVDSLDGAAGDSFGFSVAVSGDTAVIGASFKTVGTKTQQGQAYVFVRAGTSWSQQAVLVDSAVGAAGDLFGTSVAVSGDTTAIGTPGRTVGANPRQGQAYVFVRSGTSWSQQATLVDSLTGAAADFFGASVGVSGDTVIISAYFKTVGGNPQQGQAYVFVRSGSTWSPQAILIDTKTGAAMDSFGTSVSVSEDTAVIGAHYKTVGGNPHQGQAYVFVRSGSPNGTACTLGRQCASTFCVDGLCCNEACGDGATADCVSCLGAQTGDTDGSCAPILQAANHTCRSAVGVCDQPELCDGISERCPPDGLYQSADHYLCRAATSCSRDTYCDGSTAHCPPSLCLTPRF